ncbi:MAG TPA: biopolymer transporter ExbD [Opitutaceae bacterium]|nr:biopolymer transporter ExbD [Opitutaceae bacterium]
MARTFRRHRTTQPIAELNVTNLIDLGFTLLIIFMLAAPLITQEQTVPLKLPVASKSPQDKPDPATRTIAIAVDAKGNYYVDGRLIPFNELVDVELKRYAAEAKPPLIRLRGDGEVAWKKIAVLFNELTKRGLSRVSIDYETKG